MKRYSFDENGNEIMPAPKTVSEINEYIRSLIEEEMLIQDIYVQGEISNFKNHIASGHFYFTLKDEKSEIKAVMFRTYTRGVKFKIENGLKVILHARVGVYPQGGTYQLYVDSIQPDGVGGLHLAYEQLKAKLLSEGLFDEAHKKALPKFPKRIGVITSQTGAAVRDIINVATRRFPIAEIVLFPTLVQGDGAAEQLIYALEYFNVTKNVDVIIIGRGGGSIEDLWAFNDERLARTIYNSEIPVVSGVGHEIDFTICDFVSDVRAATPSAAAEIVTPDISDIKRELKSYNTRALYALEAKLNDAKKRLDNISRNKVLSKPEAILDVPQMKLSAIVEKLDLVFNNAYSSKKSEFLRINSQLLALNPMAVLQRGYSTVFNSEDKVVKSVECLELDEKIKIEVSDGTIDAVVIGLERKRS